jgi:hypothetical protein
MAVYVDDMNAPFGGMRMCHMIADFDEELHMMADRIGVQRKWWQRPPEHDSHYDIAASKVALAVKAGAVRVTLKQLAAMNYMRRLDGFLPPPEKAEAMMRKNFATRNRKLIDDIRQGELTAEHMPSKPPDRKLLPDKAVASDDGPPIRVLVGQVRAAMRDGLELDYALIEAVLDKLQWVAKGYGLWGP